MMEYSKKNSRMWSRLGSRGTFGKSIFDLAKDNDDFMVLSADLGKSSGLKKFMEEYEDRFINVGIAEQNMISIAAGIAREGIPVFASSFAPFVTMRSCEQMRIDAGYMNLNVKAVGLGSGVAMAYLGNSHYGLEDVAIMRSIPNMTIVSPADGASIAKTVEKAINWDGPMYIRLTGTVNTPIIYPEDFDFEIGKGIVLEEGSDITFIASGSMVFECLEASKILKNNNVSVGVIDMHTVKPLDIKLLDNVTSKSKYIVTVEEHFETGGLGSAVSQYLTKEKKNNILINIGLPDKFIKGASYSYILNKYGLKSEHIAARVLKEMNL
ncbi:MAG: transketolase C-terminal domain-containing protein [Clostridium sp.]|nr:transketolase C-terminal domain-containing protein [Clostridium sp.]